MSGAGNRMLDFGLLALTTESDRVFLCTADPVDYAAANSTHVGVKNGSRGSMFYAISTPLQGGRLASLAGFLDGDITSNGNANFVVVADSINQNILITEALAQPQAVKVGGKFSIATLDVILGKSSQPQPVNLTVGSPVIDLPSFTRLQPASKDLIVASPVIGAPILVATQSGWTNIPIPNMVGLFTCEYDATPSALGLDNATGLSNGPAASFVDMACIVRFSSQLNANSIDARNGGAYATDSVLNYVAGQTYHVRIVGNITTHIYSVFIKPPALAEVQIATNYAFRTEQNAVTQLNNVARNATDTGTVAISNITFNSLLAVPLTVGSPAVPAVAYNGKLGFVASNLVLASPTLNLPVTVVKKTLSPASLTVTSPAFVAPSLVINATGQAAGAFNAQSGDFTISWDASPTTNLEDSVMGLSNGAPVLFSDFACAIRFFTAGNIECRNGNTYTASLTVPYSAGLSFHFRLNVRISTHTYDVYVTPQGQAEVLLANNFAFRTEQASITTLSYLGKLVTTGDVQLSNMINPPPPAIPPVVTNQTMSLTTNGTGWVAGDLVGTMTATNLPTSWAITAGNSSGYFAISNTGAITVTSAGVTALGGATGTVALTVRATNTYGNGTGTATINYSPSVGNTLHATTANFLSQVAAAQTNDTILLANGNYGTWGGTNKKITIAPEVGASPFIILMLNNGAANFTVDGGHTEIAQSTNGMIRATSFTSPGIIMGPSEMNQTPGPQNITITRCWFNSSSVDNGLVINGPTNSNIVIDRCWFTNILTATAALWFPYTGDAHVTVSNCYFSHCSSDATQIGAQFITFQDCEFDEVNPLGHPEYHTDCTQIYGGNNVTIRRCYMHNFEQAIGAFDGTGSNIIEDNVIQGYPYSNPPHYITIGGDRPGSIVNHNTLSDGRGMDFGSKAGSLPSQTFVRNNITPGGVSLSGPDGNATLSQFTNNMYQSGATSPNFNGTAVYVGGAQPTTYQGFKLASNSAGRNAATDGLDVGARIA